MEQKYIYEYKLCEKCFRDLIRQIKDGNRFQIKPINRENFDYWSRDCCECECCCFEECDCSECQENGCEQDCSCECTCSTTCKCVIGQMHTIECGHDVLIRIIDLNARVFSDNTTALISVNSVRKQVLDFAGHLEEKKERNTNNTNILLYLDH